MSNIFLLQIITSFLAGGGTIALLSLYAEKAPSNISGIILSFPSTIVLGLFFMAWTISNTAVAEAHL